MQAIADLTDGLALSAADILVVDDALSNLLPGGDVVVTRDATLFAEGRGFLFSSSGGEIVTLDINDQIII